MNDINTTKKMKIIEKKWLIVYYTILIIALLFINASYNQNNDIEKKSLERTYLENQKETMNLSNANKYYGNPAYDNDTLQIGAKRTENAFINLVPLTNITKRKVLEFNTYLIEKYESNVELSTGEFLSLKNLIDSYTLNVILKDKYVTDKYILYELLGIIYFVILFISLRFIIVKTLSKFYKRIVFNTILILYIFTLYNFFQINRLESNANTSIENLIRLHTTKQHNKN